MERMETTRETMWRGKLNEILSPHPEEPHSVTIVGATIVKVRTPQNAALVGQNSRIDNGAIGVYGEYGCAKLRGADGSGRAGIHHSGKPERHTSTNQYSLDERRPKQADKSCDCNRRTHGDSNGRE
jgi:hypothetical protein